MYGASRPDSASAHHVTQPWVRDGGAPAGVTASQAARASSAQRGAIRHFVGKLPILGVCLGHQSIGAALGGNIIRAKVQMHGKVSTIHTDQAGVYAGLPQDFDVVRYHSLAIERETMPQELVVTSQTDDGEIMGVRHRGLAGTRTPLEGVQFHPESILSEHGHAMLRNFIEMSRAA